MGMIFQLKRNSVARQFLAPMLLSFAFIISSCYYDYGLSIEEYDVVATFYDTNANFTRFRTYSMPDSVYHIVDQDKEDDITREYDQLILDQVNENMQALGYQKIENPTQENMPDLFLRVAVTTTDHYQAYYNYGWWGWGWYPGWGVYYPWYPTGSVYSYTTGSVLIDMIDVENADIEQEILPAVWYAGINGLLGDSSRNVRNRLVTNINQCFEQSPYLGVSE